MKNKIAELYKLLDTNPKDADQLAINYISESNDQNEIDELNWARAYALVALNNYIEAKKIWLEIFNRTKSHKALHQVGYVERSAGNLETALSIYENERQEISNSDQVALGANLYELSYCNLLLGNNERALHFFHKYELLDFEEPDLIERACFYRLKGDLFAANNIESAKIAYMKSLSYFKEANDDVGASEIQSRLLDTLKVAQENRIAQNVVFELL